MYARDLRAWSHLVAWVGLIGSLILGLLLFSIGSCNSKTTYYQNSFIREYKKSEDKIMKKKIKERADKLADACVYEFLEEKRRQDDWDRIAQLQGKLIDVNGKVSFQNFDLIVDFDHQ